MPAGALLIVVTSVVVVVVGTVVDDDAVVRRTCELDRELRDDPDVQPTASRTNAAHTAMACRRSVLMRAQDRRALPTGGGCDHG